MTVPQQFIDYATVSDTGLNDSASIQPYTSENANPATMNRVPENLRKRTEVSRTAVDNLLFLADADRATLLYGDGTITWNGTVVNGGDGKIVLSGGSKLVIKPFFAPNASGFGTLRYGTLGNNQIIFTTWPRYDGSAAPLFSYNGGNRVTIKIVDTLGASLALVADPANPTYGLILTLDSTVATATAVSTFFTAHTLAFNLGMKASVEGTSTGSNLVAGALATSRVTGSVDAEQHWITAAGLVSFFSDSANCLGEGDCLAISYTSLSGAPPDGRRTSVKDSLTAAYVADANLFRVLRHGELVPGCLPIAAVAGGNLYLINGLQMKKDAVVSLTDAPFLPLTGGTLTGPVTFTPSTGVAITAVAGTGGKAIDASAAGSLNAIEAAAASGSAGVFTSTGAAAALRGSSSGAAPGVSGIASSVSAGAYGGYFQSAGANAAVQGTATGSGGVGVQGQGGAGGHGGVFVGGSNGDGVHATGAGSGAGLIASGGSGTGAGATFTAGSSGNNSGAIAAGHGSGPGLTASGGATGDGVIGNAGTSGGVGVKGDASGGVGYGGSFRGNSTSAALHLTTQALPSGAVAGDMVISLTNGANKLQIYNVNGCATWTNVVTQPALSSPWAHGADALVYWIDTGGVVHLNGQISRSTGTGTDPIFTLPAAYRPLYDQYFVVVDSLANVGVIKVATTGVVAGLVSMSFLNPIIHCTFRVVN